jgi:NAD(P)-dependent dehydrogenase (short-subunit alcohol dehydrogenase family)
MCSFQAGWDWALLCGIRTRHYREDMGMSTKVALVTGAGTGVGKAVAIALAKAGYNLVLAGRRKEPLDETASAINATGQQALAVPTDVSKRESIVALFEKVKSSFGRLDVLFNNAGIGAPPVPIEELPYEAWQNVVATNLTGMFLCTQEAIKIMKAQNPRGGRIINNGSISAHTPRPFSIAYTSTKHAVTGLTKSTALDCRPHDICCGQVDIGNAATPMTDRMVKGDGVLQPDGSKKIEARMDADHVGNAVAYMASLPLDTNVLFMTVMANKMPFVGRG